MTKYKFRGYPYQQEIAMWKGERLETSFLSLKIEFLRKQLGYSKKQMREKLGWSRQTIAAIDAGRFFLTISEAERICSIFKELHYPKEWLLDENNILPEEESHVTQSLHQCLDYKSKIDNIVPDMMKTMIIDNTMQGFEMGEYVIGKKIKDDISLFYGKDVLYDDGRETILVRRLCPGNNQDSYSLICTNPYSKYKPFIIHDDSDSRIGQITIRYVQ